MTTMINIPTDTRLKSDVESLCGKFGVTIADVFNNLMRNMVATGTLPSEVNEPTDEDVRSFKEAIAFLQEQSVLNGNSEMTMEEIDAEIAAARRERRENVKNCY